MPDLSLFDSLTHPTLDGTWTGSWSGNNTLRTLEEQMFTNNVQWAFAVGMKGIGDYSLPTYADYIRTSSRSIFPIAYYDFDASESRVVVRRKLDEIVRYGYAGIKLHPRFSGISLREKTLLEVLIESAERKLLVLICTYFYGGTPFNSYLDLAPLVTAIPKACKVILLHGADVNLLAMMEIVREHPNVLLDLSFTLCRYEGSSVDLDIRYLFRHFDRRICVGSDSPQFGLDQLRRRFNELSTGVELEKCLNVAHRNLRAFVEGG